MTVTEGVAGLGDRHFPQFLSALPNFKSRGVGVRVSLLWGNQHESL